MNAGGLAVPHGAAATLVTLGGLFVGMISWSLFSRWLRLLLMALGISTAGANAVPRRRLALLPLFALHPVSWAIVALPCLTYVVLAHHRHGNALWFVAGFYSSFLVIGATLSLHLSRRRARNKRLTDST